MPRHTLEIFARGLGVWGDFPASARAEQLAHMSRLLDDLYPTFRLFLYDGRMRYSVPYTIFGSIRAAIYVGDMYLVLNATQPVQALTRHFDNLIRSAIVNPHESAAFAQKPRRLGAGGSDPAIDRLTRHKDFFISLSHSSIVKARAMTNPIEALIAEKGVLLADGATGTNLFAMGLEAGEAPELLNETAPETIATLHQGFVDAGADIILTNSFGGTRHRLKLHHAQDRVFALNKKAAEIARGVADKAGRKVIVAGSVGPTGELLVPLGALTYDEAVEAFAEQIEGLKAGGAEVAWIETMSAPDEIRAAAEAAIRVGLPYTYTGSFDTAGRTMMGLLPKDIHGVVDGLAERPLGVGANCGVGASDILASLLDMTEARPDATVIVKGNCGIPEFRGTEIHYSGTPELMADYVRLAVDGGAKIVGGCCGTTFGHLAAMRTGARRAQEGGAPDHRDDRRAHRPDAQQAGRRPTRPRPAKRAASAGAAGPENPLHARLHARRPYRSSRSRRAFFRISRAFSACAAVSEPRRSRL